MTPSSEKLLGDWLDQVPASWVEMAIERASAAGARTPRYIGGIIRNWRERGAIDAPRPSQENSHATTQPGSASRPQADGSSARKPWADSPRRAYDPALESEFAGDPTGDAAGSPPPSIPR